MKPIFLLGSLVAGVALAATGCGDDEDDGDDGGSTGGTAGTEPTVQCTPGAGGACQNDTDCPKVESGMARSAAQTCGLGCQQDPDPAACSVSCVVENTDLTNACAVCYSTLVGCAGENCLAECSADPAGEACVVCQVESGCRTEFDTCSGLRTTPMPVP